MSARGFCTCKRDFPTRPEMTPPDNATWHFLCDKPVLPPAQHEPDPAKRAPRPYLSDADWSLLDIYSGNGEQ